MKILGFSQGGHDSSYAILEDGVIVIHEELERINRIKETNDDILEFYANNRGSLDEFDYIVTFHHADHKWYPPRFKQMLDNNDSRAKIIGHHKSHAANAFYSSEFDNALIFSIDGGGWDFLDMEAVPPDNMCPDGKAYGMSPGTFTVWVGEGTDIKHVMYMTNPNIGGLWDGLTKGVFGLHGAGPPYGSQAGTVMGMAAHGNPERFGSIPNFPLSTEPMPPVVTEQDRFDFAAATQQWTEETIRTVMKPFIEALGIKKVCITGGVALNCVANGKVKEWFGLEDVFVPPVPYDAGLAIGTAQYLYHHVLGYPKSTHRSYKTPYLGNSYSLKDISIAMSEVGDKVSVQYASDQEVCTLLNQQKIISLYGGRSESGRRALGNRSIVADPRQKEMKDYINQKTKHRQWFRPFAPSILREHVAEWFVEDIDSPYMNFAVPFKEEKKSIVPVVVHADGTGRLQTVSDEDNSRYYQLLTAWHQLTGVPILVNTSFNDREPIEIGRASCRERV